MSEKKHPYIGQPDYKFWKKEPAIKGNVLFDPVIDVSFKICRDEPVVTAGSCFAQHVARHLSKSGFNYLVTEKAHPIINRAVAKEHNYGMFTARYGNIYTARQLKQLLLRAYGEFQPVESVWKNTKGQLIDPFRPQVQKNGYISKAELVFDRHVHFSAIRKSIKELSVFVFTLGLTEAWVDTRDGAIFPLAPGVVGGNYREDNLEFRNYQVAEIVEDLQWCIDFIRSKNDAAKFIFTVSPVALNATMENKHVFVATTYSKSVLRVAAEVVCSGNQLCDYFPSYEIITSPYVRGRYFGPDCRSVTEEGVSHVMSVFLKHYGEQEAIPVNPESNIINESTEHLEAMQKIMDVLCDEEAIDSK